MEVTRTFDLLQRQLEKFPKEDALAGKIDGQWRKYSTAEYIEIVNNFSYGLLELGIKKGEKIATIFTNNKPEWNFIDFGIAQIGAIHVPIYPTISDEDHVFILNHSDSVLLFVSDKAIYKKIKNISDQLPAIKKIYSISKIEEANFWEEITELGKTNADKQKNNLIYHKNSVQKEDIATIIYTSGTTGISKGVMLSHNNLITNVIATAPIQPMDHKDTALSFLPLCHVYERLMIYHYQYKGISIYYAEGMGTIMANLLEIKPSGFNTVPRLLEKVYLTIIAKGKDLTGFKKILFFWALHLGLKYEIKNRGFWYNLKLKIADKFVFHKWRMAIGGNIKIIASGGSSLQPRLARIFWAAGIPVIEGYGLTETSPIISVNNFNPDKLKFGTVGPVIENVIVKIADDGEILCKGPNVMMGYYKDEEYTKTVIDDEGWFHTGDIGTFEDSEFLKITDRKKEIFKLSSGKYIAPQVIENKFKVSNLIDQIMIIGENEKFASALISPNFNYLHFYAQKHKIHFRDNKVLIKHPEIIKRVQKEVDEINNTLGVTEHIKRFRLVTEEWSPQTGELSPTLKLKRKVILEKYKHLLKEIYISS